MILGYIVLITLSTHGEKMKFKAKKWTNLCFKHLWQGSQKWRQIFLGTKANEISENRNWLGQFKSEGLNKIFG